MLPGLSYSPDADATRIAPSPKLAPPKPPQPSTWGPSLPSLPVLPSLPAWAFGGSAGMAPQADPAAPAVAVTATVDLSGVVSVTLTVEETAQNCPLPVITVEADGTCEATRVAGVLVRDEAPPAETWKAWSGRSTGPASYQFGDLSRSILQPFLSRSTPAREPGDST